MHILPVIPETEAGSNFLQEDHLTPFLKPQAVHVLKTTKICKANDKLLQIVGCIKHYVQVGQLRERVSFLLCERLVVPAIFWMWLLWSIRGMYLPKTC